MTFGRYRVVPETGTAYRKEELAALPEHYLFDEITERMKTGPFRFKILIQLAAEGDKTDDATVRWPETRPLLEFGTMELTQLIADNATEQKHIIFDPIPRIDGIEPAADPLFELRGAIYLISGRRRRAATLEQPAT